MKLDWNWDIEEEKEPIRPPPDFDAKRLADHVRMNILELVQMRQIQNPLVELGTITTFAIRSAFRQMDLQCPPDEQLNEYVFIQASATSFSYNIRIEPFSVFQPDLSIDVLGKSDVVVAPIEYKIYTFPGMLLEISDLLIRSAR